MKAKYLFPSICRIIGWLLAIPGFILGIPVVYNDYQIPGFDLRLHDGSRLFVPEVENLTNELALALVIVGLLLVAFSRIRHEDELTAKLRLNSLYWAILINLILQIFVGILIYLPGIKSLQLIQTALTAITDNLSFYVYNLFMPLVIFITRFYYLLFRNKQEYQLKPLRFLSYKPYGVIGKGITLILIVLTLYGVFDNLSPLSNLYYFLPLPLLLWTYSKEPNEDEYINTLRLDAMQIAVYVNYAVLLISNALLYGLDFLLILIVNLSTIPLIFLLVFHYRLWRLRRENVGVNAALLV